MAMNAIDAIRGLCAEVAVTLDHLERLEHEANDPVEAQTLRERMARLRLALGSVTREEASRTGTTLAG